MHHRTLFLTLKIFSSTGGIEKVCKVAGMALHELLQQNVRIFSVYDKQTEIDEKYFPSSVFRSWAGKKIKYIYNSIKVGISSKVVILSHINLMPIAYVIKVLSPKTKLVLFAHGIEVWQPLSGFKIKLLKKIDLIIAVSNYTKQRMLSLHNLGKVNCKVLNNSLDPFLKHDVNEDEISLLYKKYNLPVNNFILITVTRISCEEKYKGHDKVLESLSFLVKSFPNISYLIVGKYDKLEKKRLDSLIEKYKLEDNIIFCGFVPDSELAAHYQIADVFIMPSKGEGFGIAFIEAMYFGLPVIAGNKDGSVDALLNGQLGELVNPDSIEEISAGIRKIMLNKVNSKPDINLLMQHFNYPLYKNNLKQMINSVTG